MITFIAHLKVRSDNGPDFEALMIKVRDLTLANEPGVLYYDFAKSVEIPDTYCVVEVYQDAAAQASHMQRPWVSESIPLSRALIEGRFDIRQYVSPGTAPVARQLKES